MNVFQGMQSINFDEVRRQFSDAPALQHLLRFLAKNPVSTVGYYLKSLSDEDFEKWEELIELENPDADEDTPTKLSERSTLHLMAACMIFATAEGLTIEELLEQDPGMCVEYLVNILMCVGLERKGIVDVFYENLTFEMSEEHFDKPIVQRK